MARVLLGVTGGIAAYKACELLRLLVRSGHEVVPLVTRGADRFVRRETFEALAGRSPRESAYPHLERADLLVVAPLTANTLARIAHGLADDLVTEAALAHDGPILVAPAMNTRMWLNPATQANVETLRARGDRADRAGGGEPRRGRDRHRPDERAGSDLRPRERAARAQRRARRASASSSAPAARASRSTPSAIVGNR